MGKSHTKRSSTVINSNYFEQWVNQGKSLGKFVGQTGKDMPLYGKDSTLLNGLPNTLHLFLPFGMASLFQGFPPIREG